MSNVNFLRKQLYDSINELINDYHPYLTDDKDYFSRNRKLSLKTLIEAILFMVLMQSMMNYTIFSISIIPLQPLHSFSKEGSFIQMLLDFYLNPLT